MTEEEAIEILDSTKAPPLMHPESKYNEALKVGIKAMKEKLKLQKGGKQ